MGALDGRVAIVTGAGAGLGEGIAHELAAAGANVAVLEIDADSGTRSAEQIAKAHGVEARAYRTDVSKSKDANDAFEAVMGDFGRLDIAVNNAGISRIGPHTQDVSDEDWLQPIAVLPPGVFSFRPA